MKQETNSTIHNRIRSLNICNTPEELSFNIWTKELEEAIGSRKEYRNGFVNWIESRKNGTSPQWKYVNIKEFVEAIWPPYLDEDKDDYFPLLRNALEQWVNEYIKKT